MWMRKVDTKASHPNAISHHAVCCTGGKSEEYGSESEKGYLNAQQGGVSDIEGHQYRGREQMRM